MLRRPDGLDEFAAEIPPCGGALASFQRSRNFAWTRGLYRRETIPDVQLNNTTGGPGGPVRSPPLLCKLKQLNPFT